MTFDELLQRAASNSRSCGNAWVDEPGFQSLYARIGQRLVKGSMRQTIDLANFEVVDKGQGVFTRFVKKIEQYQLPIFVESVINDRLAKHLPKLGFVLVADSNPPNFLKLPLKNS